MDETNLLKRLNFDEQRINRIKVEVFACLVLVALTPAKFINEYSESVSKLSVAGLGISADLSP